jgi:hypothetical protein
MTTRGRPSPRERTRLSPALVAILARMVEAKLAVAGSGLDRPASQPARTEGMVEPRAGEPAGRSGG